jgi:hypothetical protein
MDDNMRGMLQELEMKGLSTVIECSYHSWLVSINGEPVYTSGSATAVNAFLSGMLTATIH